MHGSAAAAVGGEQLVDAHRPVEVLERALAEVVERQALRFGLVVVEQRPGGLGDEHLPALAGTADAGGAVDGETDVVPVRDRRLTRVDADPDADVGSLGPSCAASACCAAAAAASAEAGVVNATKNESPSVPTSCPPCSAKAARSSRAWSSITSV